MDDPGGDKGRQRHEGAEAIDGYRTDLKKNRQHRVP
jgi:hypothetical protein